MARGRRHDGLRRRPRRTATATTAMRRYSDRVTAWCVGHAAAASGTVGAEAATRPAPRSSARSMSPSLMASSQGLLSRPAGTGGEERQRQAGRVARAATCAQIGRSVGYADARPRRRPDRPARDPCRGTRRVDLQPDLPPAAEAATDRPARRRARPDASRRCGSARAAYPWMGLIFDLSAASSADRPDRGGASAQVDVVDAAAEHASRARRGTAD